MHGHNKAFEADPFGYVSRMAINHLGMKVYGEKTAFDFDDANNYDDKGRIIPGQYSVYSRQVNQAKGAIELAKAGEFDLEPVALQGGTAMFLRFVVPGVYAPSVAYGGSVRGADPSIKAYWLGYLMPGLQGAGKTKIPYIDLPKAAPARKLMLTGAMNGCSMVVAHHPADPTMLRVYHDSVHNVDTFQNDVVICRIDYTDEGFASANLIPAQATATARPRSASVGAPQVVTPAPVRGRSSSVGGPASSSAPLTIPCARTSYGDMAQFTAISGKGTADSNRTAKVRTSFNFLYFDDATAHWVAVSQPLETLPSVARPVQGWFESDTEFNKRQKTHQAKGTAVAIPPSGLAWRAQIPY